MAESQPYYNAYTGMANNPLSMIDPDGRLPILPLIWGAFKAFSIGFGVGATVEASSQLIQHGEIKDGTDVLISGGAGGLTGGSGALMTSIGKKAVVSGVLSMTEGYVKSETGKIQTDYSATDAILDGGLGGASSLLGDVASKVAKGSETGQALKSDATQAKNTADRLANNATSKPNTSRTRAATAAAGRAQSTKAAYSNYGQGARAQAANSAGKTTIGNQLNGTDTNDQINKGNIYQNRIKTFENDNTRVEF